MKNRAWTIFMLLVLLGISGCVSSKQGMTLKELHSAYQRAIQDAKVAENSEISRNLVAIVPGNKNLIWDPKTGDVLVVNWTSGSWCNGKTGKVVPLPENKWVTVAPEVKKFCWQHNISEEQMPLRVEQLLGLPPDTGKIKFVEMWVSPDDLFRPSPDPEVSDHEAELDFPVSPRVVTVNAKYKEWFNNRKEISYTKNGYPWTRLGYTYDWGNPRSEIGLSEFVVPKGTKVRIHSVSDNKKYCVQER